uniref:Bm10228 n=1 Tax=Brugia malayi TaxID=6279 RepID=A0A0H5S7W4_BRUMA|nr:Bm10228 [Brugia malayi]
MHSALQNLNGSGTVSLKRVNTSMTVLSEETPSREECFVTLKKIPKVHGRAIIGVSYIQDPYSLEDYLITCAHDSLKVWHVDKSDPGSLTEKQEIKGWRSGAQDFDVTPDGAMIAVVGIDSLLHVFNLSLSDFTYNGDIFNMGFMEQWYVRISPCRTRYLTVSFSGFLSRLSLKGAADNNLSFPGARQVSSLSYSPDNKMIAVANNEGIVTILNAPKLEIRFFFEAHAIKVRATCFSPSSDSLLTGSDDKIVKLYTIRIDKAQLVKSFCGHRSCITAVKYNSRDPQMFASSSNDGSVILWSTTQDSALHVFQGAHEGVVKSLSFSIDGTHIASVGEDRAICLHRLGNQKSVAELAESSWSTSQELQNECSQQKDYNATIVSGNSILRAPENRKNGEEEDEILVRARRDLEGINLKLSEVEGIVLRYI